MKRFLLVIWVYIILPLLAALVVPLSGMFLAGILYVIGAEFTENSIKEGAIFMLYLYTILGILFIFRQIDIIGKVKKNTGLSLEEIAKLPKAEQRRIVREAEDGPAKKQA